MERTISPRPPSDRTSMVIHGDGRLPLGRSLRLPGGRARRGAVVHRLDAWRTTAMSSDGRSRPRTQPLPDETAPTECPDPPLDSVVGAGGQGTCHPVRML